MNIVKEKDIYGGEYYLIEADEKKSKFDICVEEIDNFAAFCCSYMKQPFFMDATAGNKISDIPKETQWLGILHTDNTYSIYLSLAWDKFRTAFYGSENSICVAALTGDDNICDNSFYGLYKISGDNFYELMNKAAKSVSGRYNTVRLRTEKALPGFVDYFGWCTWDSFYDKVTAHDVVAGLDSFKKGGFVPKLLILDDGWQGVNACEKDRGHWKLSSFKPNEKFNYNLHETINEAKEKYGVERFFVWHAVGGYWGGVDVNSPDMQKYNPTISNAKHTHELKEVSPKLWNYETFDYGLVAPEKAGEFYNDYHSYLKSEGVDGLKIDVQGAIVGHAAGRGGREKITQAFRNGLEASVNKNFGGELINCMSCNNDTIYHVKDTNVMRSSGDFSPGDPKSHSQHIYINGMNSIWMSEFTCCDWDMFHTQHEYAPYHAASRAISGGPVYVSDRVDEHNFALIDKLVSANGKIFRAEHIARLTADCLFRDPIEEKIPFKIFNTNKHSGVVGVFATEHEDIKTVSAAPTDIDGYKDGDYAAYSYKDNCAKVIRSGEKIAVALKRTEFDIITFAPIDDGFAVIGLTNKMNSGATVRNIEKADGQYCMNVDATGELLIYCEKDIESISADGKALQFTENEGFVSISVDKACPIMINIKA